MNDYEMKARRAARDDALCTFIDKYSETHRYAPTLREVGEAFGLRSKATTTVWLRRLRKEGRVSWTEGDARTLHTTTTGEHDGRNQERPA